MKKCAVLLLLLLLGACSTTPPRNSSENLRLPEGVVDGRAEFRSVFCAAVKRDGLQSDDGCSDLLGRFSDEKDPQGETALSASIRPSVDLMLVPGIFGECLGDKITMLSDAVQHVERYGYKAKLIPTRGRASSSHNARIIRDHVMEASARSSNRRIMLVTYSKGTADTLVALADYPEMLPHIAALVSLAGVVRGSPLADQLEAFYTDTFAKLPYSACPKIDQGEVHSLGRADRLAWLASHPLPKTLPYFSIAALPASGNISAVLRPTYALLSRVDPNNDSQVIYYDSIIPGSIFLGYANADHWAITLPFEIQAPELARTLITRNHFPRPQLLEAILRVVEACIDKSPATTCPAR